jgi:uncharacterized protein (DUF58 family)
VRTPFGNARIPALKKQAGISLWLTFPERGKARLDSLKIYSGFPLGFFERHRRIPFDMDLLIYPKPEPGRMPFLRPESLEAPGGLPFCGEWSDEVRELRPFRQTDPLKWIDWKATARRGIQVVREFYRIQGDELMIDISAMTGSLENRLSLACWLVLEGYREKLATGLIMPARKIEPARGPEQKKTLLEALSLA